VTRTRKESLNGGMAILKKKERTGVPVTNEGRHGVDGLGKVIKKLSEQVINPKANRQTPDRKDKRGC